MFSKATVASILVSLSLAGFQAPVIAEQSSDQKADQKADTKPEPKAGSQQKQELSGYFISFYGSARSLSQAMLNGQNVISAPIVTLTLPVNISGYVVPGANELVINYISNPKDAMTILIEKRTVGPKKEEVARVVLAANESNGSAAKKTIAFNLPKDQPSRAINSLSDDDKKAIEKELQNYWTALNERKPDKLRAIYKESLDDERKLSPESAAYFDKILNREASLLRNPGIKLAPLENTGLTFKIEGDAVKLYREDKKPLLTSNEVDVQIEPVMVEVQKKAKPSQAKATMKQQIVRTHLYFKQTSQDGLNQWSVSLPPNA
ncbi:hypothetical protein BH11CYA1_BH11CYA1_39760 [soil metagenome]